MLCIVLSGMRFNWLLPVMGTREQANSSPDPAMNNNATFFIG
jgi:hypothetical protein